MSNQSDGTGRSTLLLINPASREGAGADLEQGLASLRAAGMAIEVVESEGVEASREAIHDRCHDLDLVIVAGGDGTISSVAGTLLECELPFAILPLGTANDLARSLGIEGGLSHAFELIKRDQRQRIDLAEVNGLYFFNAANLGLGTKVTEELESEAKARLGVFAYLKAVTAALTRAEQFRVEAEVDGHCHRFRSIQLAVGNGRFYGGGNVVDRHARINDGKLSLYSLRPQRLWELLSLAPLLRRGEHRLARRVFNTSGREINIRTWPAGMAIHADGEPVTETPAMFKVIPAALEVIVAPGAAVLQDQESQQQ
ncbi:lipid kinase [Microbulbifer flavimaris]|uniref:Lipid kinase n=1 Tax=Microbulbifer flavimaris TaxID=1781068 RepID=A0ABX4I6B1_9GAMM|nr:MULTISPECIES: lipid kinase [Microbulbifer]KUJ84951.1 lipid kinase [Microbulbifer sp. ZGT114]PCO07054.1 lipid kinase [Microbulbifer flavimaris]